MRARKLKLVPDVLTAERMAQLQDAERHALENFHKKADERGIPSIVIGFIRYTGRITPEQEQAIKAAILAVPGVEACALSIGRPVSMRDQDDVVRHIADRSRKFLRTGWDRPIPPEIVEAQRTKSTEESPEPEAPSQ